MTRSALVLNMTFQGLEDQKQDWTNFTTQPQKIESSNGKYAWMTLIHIYLEKDFPRLPYIWGGVFSITLKIFGQYWSCFIIAIYG